MKKLSLLLICFILLFCIPVYAQGTVALLKEHLSPATIVTWLYLLGLSVLGIALHWFIDLKKSEAQDMNFTLLHYAASTWISSVISLIICIIALFIRNELVSIPSFSDKEGAFFALLGYAGDSILPFVFGFAKKAGIDIQQEEPVKK